MRVIPTIKLDMAEQRVMVRCEPFVRMFLFERDGAPDETWNVLSQLRNEMDEAITGSMIVVMVPVLKGAREHMNLTDQTEYWLNQIEPDHRVPSTSRMAEVIADSRRGGAEVLQEALDILNVARTTISRVYIEANGSNKEGES